MSKYLVSLIFFLCINNIAYAENSWNGNASIISYNLGDNIGFGLTEDVTKVHQSSNNNPVVFFQWQKNSGDGKNLKIYADSDYTSATIFYGGWSSKSNEKISFSDVELPFILCILEVV